MAAARPYSSADEAVLRSDAIVATLTVTDLTDALAGHPRIGSCRPARRDIRNDDKLEFSLACAPAREGKGYSSSDLVPTCSQVYGACGGKSMSQ